MRRWDEAAEREALRAWLATVPEGDRTLWLVFCLGAARYRLVADATLKEQQQVVVELRQRIAHLERQLAWLEPDAVRWLTQLTRARARVAQLETELKLRDLSVPAPILPDSRDATDDERVVPPLPR